MIGTDEQTIQYNNNNIVPRNGMHPVIMRSDQESIIESVVRTLLPEFLPVCRALTLAYIEVPFH